MICGTCKDAETKETTKDKVRRHRQCKGKGWCDCQHRVPEEK